MHTWAPEPVDGSNIESCTTPLPDHVPPFGLKAGKDLTPALLHMLYPLPNVMLGGVVICTVVVSVFVQLCTSVYVYFNSALPVVPVGLNKPRRLSVKDTSTDDVCHLPPDEGVKPFNVSVPDVEHTVSPVPASTAGKV